MRRQIARLQKPGQIMHGGVRVRAADGLHERGKIVVMVVTGFVIAHSRALRHLLRVGHGEPDHAVFGPRGRIKKLDSVERLTDIAAAGLRDVLLHAGLWQDGHAVARFEIVERPADRALRLVLFHGLEFKHGRARQNGVIDVKIRIFRCGRDERDLAVFDVFQQRLLLLFVEILDLVEIQQNAVRREERVKLGINFLDIGGGRSRRVELAQLSLRFFRDQVRNGRFARAGWAVEDHIGNGTALDDAAQQAVSP